MRLNRRPYRLRRLQYFPDRIRNTFKQHKISSMTMRHPENIRLYALSVLPKGGCLLRVLDRTAPSGPRRFFRGISSSMTLLQPLIARICKTHRLSVEFVNRLLEQFEVMWPASSGVHTQDFSTRGVGNDLRFKRVRTGGLARKAYRPGRCCSIQDVPFRPRRPVCAALFKTTLLFASVTPLLLSWLKGSTSRAGPLF